MRACFIIGGGSFFHQILEAAVFFSTDESEGVFEPLAESDGFLEPYD